MTKTSRLSWIDYARGIAIILVSYRHVFEGAKEAGIAVQQYDWLEYANIFLYSFRMPLFFIISGIFVSRSLQKRGIGKYIETRSRAILYPYFVWGTIQITLQIIFSRFTNGHPTLESYLYLFYLPREIAQFWYLYALFNVSVLYALSKYYLRLKPWHNISFGLVFFYISAYVYQEHIGIAFFFDIFHYYIFFALGDLVSTLMLDKKNHSYFESGRNLLLMLLLFAMGQTYFLVQNLSHSTAKYMYVEFYQPAIFLLIALVGCTFVIHVTFYLQKKNVMSWLTVLGRHSLYIYVAHVIVFSCVRIILFKGFGIDNVFVILISGIVSAQVVPLLMYRLAERWNIRWIFTLEERPTKKANSSANNLLAPERANQ